MPEERTRRFPPPWTVEQTPGGYKVKDANGQSLACVYGRETKGEADIAQGRTRRRGVRACLGVLVPALLLQVLDALLQIGQTCIAAWIVEAIRRYWAVLGAKYPATSCFGLPFGQRRLCFCGQNGHRCSRISD